ncbi:MAG: outer-membrane lipoprotein carrier protein LolA, partial [candidate division WOR-3 bacterium]|nr:outer-membrane lipoprotein carrier protein LolA [candidate division WOR-3 bacterium]
MLLITVLTIFVVESINCDSILANAKIAMSKITSLSGAIQREISVSRQNKFVSEGLFYYQSPNLFRLNLISPEEQEIIFDGKYLYTRIPKEKEWHIKEVSNPLEGLKDFSNIGLNFINFFEHKFKFNLRWEGKVKDYNIFLLEGSPKQDTINDIPQYRKILVWIDKTSYLPLRFETYGKSDNPTTIFVVDSLYSHNQLTIPSKSELRMGVK